MLGVRHAGFFENKAPDDEVSVHLVTTEDEFRSDQQKENFENMKESASALTS